MYHILKLTHGEWEASILTLTNGPIIQRKANRQRLELTYITNQIESDIDKEIGTVFTTGWGVGGGANKPTESKPFFIIGVTYVKNSWNGYSTADSRASSDLCVDI